jgi:hypothetical protein
MQGCSTRSRRSAGPKATIVGDLPVQAFREINETYLRDLASGRQRRGFAINRMSHAACSSQLVHRLFSMFYSSATATRRRRLRTRPAG